MEFPSDVLSVVREFSKPLLRYPKEYKETLSLLGKEEWPELKSKLSSKQADEVVLLLKICMDALKVCLTASEALYHLEVDIIYRRSQVVEVRIEYERLQEENTVAHHQFCSAFNDLRAIVG